MFEGLQGYDSLSSLYLVDLRVWLTLFKILVTTLMNGGLSIFSWRAIYRNIWSSLSRPMGSSSSATYLQQQRNLLHLSFEVQQRMLCCSQAWKVKWKVPNHAFFCTRFPVSALLEAVSNGRFGLPKPHVVSANAFFVELINNSPSK